MGDGLADFSVNDVAIDINGRLVPANAQLAGAMQAAKRLEHDKRAKPKPPPLNGNCAGCNAVTGCGPINSVKGCGTKPLK